MAADGGLMADRRNVPDWTSFQQVVSAVVLAMPDLTINAIQVSLRPGSHLVIDLMDDARGGALSPDEAARVRAAIVTRLRLAAGVAGAGPIRVVNGGALAMPGVSLSIDVERIHDDTLRVRVA